ncbi:MAG: hypothetical protein QXK87_06955 [Fervidicoccaceae archaeon]
MVYLYPEDFRKIHEIFEKISEKNKSISGFVAEALHHFLECPNANFEEVITRIRKSTRNHAELARRSRRSKKKEIKDEKCQVLEVKGQKIKVIPISPGS